jgi:Spy/CpxP family protein refolding chaperone
MNARLRALAVLIAVFLLGGSVGFVSYHYMGAKAATGTANRQAAARQDHRGPRLDEALQLSPEQAAQFKQIMDEFRPQFEQVRAEQQKKFEALRSEMGPRYEVIRAEMDRKILAILNDAQKQKFQEFQKERAERMSHRWQDRNR